MRLQWGCDTLARTIPVLLDKEHFDGWYWLTFHLGSPWFLFFCVDYNGQWPLPSVIALVAEISSIIRNASEMKDDGPSDHLKYIYIYIYILWKINIERIIIEAHGGCSIAMLVSWSAMERIHSVLWAYTPKKKPPDWRDFPVISHVWSHPCGTIYWWFSPEFTVNTYVNTIM